MSKKSQNKAKASVSIEDVTQVQTAFNEQMKEQRHREEAAAQALETMYSPLRAIAIIECPKLRADLEASAAELQAKLQAVFYARAFRLRALESKVYGQGVAANLICKSPQPSNPF